VFVARGTHASYPRRCGGNDCPQPNGALEENRYNGETGWRGNRDEDCDPLCVAALPTRKAGREPARWNAYDGRWGTADCDFLFLCSSSEAPRAPGAQERYENPWCPNGHGYFDSRNRLRRRQLPSCLDQARVPG
jgi:hypothetical protein